MSLLMQRHYCKFLLTLIHSFLVSIINKAFAVYACIFADPDTSSIGRFYMITVPSEFFRFVDYAIPKSLLAKLKIVVDHGFQIIYLIVVLGSWSIVFSYGYQMIEESNYIKSYHQNIGYGVFLLCMSTWHYACNKPPGNITTKTIPIFDHYEYDNVLYTNKLCPTLKIRKLARSKYDRFSRRHVPRFDHFCGWLNQAVGERNYRWFLLFLTIHVAMCCYGTWAMALVMYGEIMDKNLLNATFFNAVTGAEVQADYIIVFHYLFMRHFQICGVLILMSVMSVMLGIFLGFHLYITSFNMTTNEFFKWRSVQKWHKKEKQKYEQALKEGKVRKQSSNAGASLPKQEVPDVDVGCTGPVASEHSVENDIAENVNVLDPGEWC